MGNKMRFILPFLILTGFGILNAGWVIKGGWNRSIPQNEDGEAVSGITFGVGHDWMLTRKFSLYLTCDLLYSTWGATYRNKTWPTNNTQKNVVIADRYVKIGFFQIPLQIRYEYPIMKSLTLSLSTGIILVSAFADYTQNGPLEFLDLNTKEAQIYPFDYKRYEEGSVRTGNRHFDGSLSIDLSFHRIGIGLLYVHAFHEISRTSYLSLNEKINTIHCMFHVSL